MPVKSDAQRRAMYAAAEGKSTLGIPKKVGKEFIGASKGLTGLPEKVGDERAMSKRVPKVGAARGIKAVSPSTGGKNELPGDGMKLPKMHDSTHN
jgi:hypothetical protein